MSDSDQTSSINYELLVEDSLRTVVRGALAIVQEYGLLGESHFYITFRTQADGVQLDDTLKEGNPQEMTIVLQHQFWNLQVNEKYFEVELSFNDKRENLVIPFGAVTGFADPSVKFGLQFDEITSSASIPNEEINVNKTATQTNNLDKKSEMSGEVVSLDQFRKKTDRNN